LQGGGFSQILFRFLLPGLLDKRGDALEKLDKHIQIQGVSKGGLRGSFSKYPINVCPDVLADSPQ
jgi:hypothetical protein